MIKVMKPKVGDIVLFDIGIDPSCRRVMDIGVIFNVDKDGHGDYSRGGCIIQQPSGTKRCRNYLYDIENGKMVIINSDHLNAEDVSELVDCLAVHTKPFIQFELVPETAHKGHCIGKCTECPGGDVCLYIGGTPGTPGSQTDPDGDCYNPNAQIL